MYVVVCYDISDNRRRARLHELLLGYGQPVQRSVFECRLQPRQFRQLRQQARRWARGRRDSIRYYTLCDPCRRRALAAGTPLAEADPEGDFFP